MAGGLTPSGWIVLDKPVGMGSTNCVCWVKRALKDSGEAKTKVGHGGTLDPLASGVLPIALGEATKFAGRMLDAAKTYDFTVRFGAQTDTLDLEGAIVAESAYRPTRAEVEAVLPRFTGAIAQVPPAYSALKVDGQRAYALARAGVEVELKTRSVTVHDLQLHPGTGSGGGVGAPGPSTPPRTGVEFLTLSATVSKGTYVRSLARDVALALGTVGHVTMLRRTKAGPFTLDQAISLDFMDEAAKARELTRVVLPLAAGLDDIPALPVTPEEAQLLRHGQRLCGKPAEPGLYLATDDHRLVALVEVSDSDVRVVRGLNI